MLRIVNTLDALTAARLVELLDPNTPWNRALWGLSTCLSLRETLEAAEANRAGILSDASIKRLGEVCLRLMGKDPGVLDAEKQVLGEAYRSTLKFDGLAYHTIATAAEHVRSAYLHRWARAFEAATPPQPERAARSIAAHLLDEGFSGEYLHAWWTNRLYNDPQHLTLAALCDLAHADLTHRPERDFAVLIAFGTHHDWHPGSQRPG